MDVNVLRPLLDGIHGTTFATLDTETRGGASNCIRCVTKGERVIIFRTAGGSGYEARVKRRLEEAGLDPNEFQVGPLLWGTRVDDLPLIENKGKYYLQTVQLTAGEKRYYDPSGNEISPLNLSAFGWKGRTNYSQGLPKDKQVIVNTYNVENIHRIVLMGEEVFDTAVAEKGSSSILKISTEEK